MMYMIHYEVVIDYINRRPKPRYLFTWDVSCVLKYLSSLYQTGKSYSVLNSHKAMLLQTLPFFGNLWCKYCQLISRFMKGVFELSLL